MDCRFVVIQSVWLGVKSQHLLGACMFTCVSEIKVKANWQARAAKRENSKTVACLNGIAVLTLSTRM
jgi:hypothetical protein